MLTHKEEKAEGFREPSGALGDGGGWQVTSSWDAEGHPAVLRLRPAPRSSLAERRELQTGSRLGPGEGCGGLCAAWSKARGGCSQTGRVTEIQESGPRPPGSQTVFKKAEAQGLPVAHVGRELGEGVQRSCALGNKKRDLDGGLGGPRSVRAERAPFSSDPHPFICKMESYKEKHSSF